MSRCRLTDPNAPEGTNIAVLRTNGSGKSFYAKGLLTGLLLSGHRVVVFDVDGELDVPVEQGAVVVTCDLGFGTLVHRKNLPHAGIVLRRLQPNTAENQIKALTAAIGDGRVGGGAFVVLTDADVR